MMADLVTDDRPDAAIVDCGIGVGVEEGRLQDRGWKDDLVHAEIGIGVDRHRGHRPFPAPDRPAEAADIVVVRELVGTQRIAEHVVGPNLQRSEEHTSELQSLMRISYAVFCLKNKKNYQ